MKIENYSNFRQNMKAFCNKVVDENEDLIITRPGGKNVVVISLDKYNRIMAAQSLFGILPSNINCDDAKAERLRDKYMELKEIADE